MRFWSHGGFCFIQQSYDYPLIRLIGHKKNLGAFTQVNRDQRESVAKAQLKHRRSLSTTQKYCLGAPCSKEQRVFITLVIGLKARLGSQVYSPKTPGYPAFSSKPLHPGNPGMTRRTFDKSISQTLNLSKLKQRLVNVRSILKGFVKWFNSVAWQPMKSLTFLHIFFANLSF